MLKANSSVMVLPTSRAPAFSSAFTAGAVAVAGGWVASQVGLPEPVGWPATSNRALAAKDKPASGPSSAPATSRSIWGQKAPSLVPGLAQFTAALSNALAPDL